MTEDQKKTIVTYLSKIALSKGSPEARVHANAALGIMDKLTPVAAQPAKLKKFYEVVKPSDIKGAVATKRFEMSSASIYRSITIAEDDKGRTYAKLTCRDSGKVIWNIIHNKKMWWFGCNHAEFVASSKTLKAA